MFVIIFDEFFPQWLTDSENIINHWNDPVVPRSQFVLSKWETKHFYPARASNCKPWMHQSTFYRQLSGDDTNPSSKLTQHASVNNRNDKFPYNKTAWMKQRVLADIFGILYLPRSPFLPAKNKNQESKIKVFSLYKTSAHTRAQISAWMSANWHYLNSCSSYRQM